MEVAMDSEENRPRSSRDTFLVVMLFVLIGIPLFVFFNVITSGLFILMVVVASGLGVLGAIHYFLWGRSLTQETAGEREEQEALEASEYEDWPYETPTGPREIGPL
jgi:hypothetical protein